MHSFLHRCTDQILSRHGESLADVCIIVPGRRPMIYLREILVSRLSKPSWAPAMNTIEEFMESVSGKQRMDATELLFTAYEVYREIADDPEEFDSFLTWVPPLLADFNEVDNYREDGEVVFTNLMEVRGIEEWSFQEEDLSPGQERFQQRWELTGAFYSALKARLLEGDLMTTGLIRRIAASRVEAGWTSPYKHIYFLGFNALSESAQRVFFGLEKAGQATIAWDADRAFVNPHYHEAGLFLRAFEKQNGRLNLPEKLDVGAIDVQCHEATSRLAQVKVMGALLAHPDLVAERTAVILADESLLIPALNSIPLEGDFNITLGYSLRLTPAFDLLNRLPEIRRRTTRNGLLWHDDLRALVAHPVLSASMETHQATSRKVLGELAESNQAYVKPSRLLETCPGNEAMSLVYAYLTLDGDALGQIKALHGLMTALESSHVEREHRWMREILFLTARELNQCITALEKARFPLGESAVQTLLRKAVGAAQVDFRGEPKRGLQVMGMLETRALGFERVIVVGANEGNMPRSSRNQSFIPYDLKRHYHLPTHRERDAIYAYYFFRLLQDAKRVDFIYSSQGETVGTAEPSRYIAQLEHMRQSAAIARSNWVLPLEKKDSFPVLHQDESAIRAIAEVLRKGLSPSALNTYLRCPLDFYLKYALKFREPDAVEESFSDALFGTLVHGMLELLYLNGQKAPKSNEPPLNILLDQARIRVCMERLPAMKLDILKGTAPLSKDLPFLESGVNRLTFETAVNYVQQFLKWEMVQAEGDPCTLLYLEAGFSRTLEFENQSITIKGMIDRIDRKGSTIRIIDYKTGSVGKSDVTAPSDAQSFLRPDKYKGRQLVMYDLMTEEEPWRENRDVICAMISLRKLSQGLVSAHVEGKNPIPVSDDQKAAFLSALQTSVDDMLQEDRTWTHEPDSDYCTYCES